MIRSILIAVALSFSFSAHSQDRELSTISTTMELCAGCTPNSITETGNISWTWVHDASGSVAVYRSDQSEPISFANAEFETGVYTGTSGSIANICFPAEFRCGVFDAAFLPRVPIDIPEAPMIPDAPTAIIETLATGVTQSDIILGFTGNIATSYKIGESSVEDISSLFLEFIGPWLPRSSNSDLSIFVGQAFDNTGALRPFTHHTSSGIGRYVNSGAGIVSEIGSSPFGQDTILGTENGQSFYATVSANGTPTNPSFVPGVSEFLEITSEGIVVRLDTGECAIAYPNGGSVSLTAPFGSNCVDATETQNGVIHLLEQGSALVTEVRVTDVMDSGGGALTVTTLAILACRSVARVGQCGNRIAGDAGYTNAFARGIRQFSKNLSDSQIVDLVNDIDAMTARLTRSVWRSFLRQRGTPRSHAAFWAVRHIDDAVN